MKLKVRILMKMDFIEVCPKMTRQLVKLFKKIENKDCKIDVEVDNE